MDNHIFRSALGGFNRQDVTEYIGKMAQEHQERLTELEQEGARQAAELEQARAALERLAPLEAEAEQLRQQCRQLTEELAAALISYSAYDMGDVYSLSHNAVQFDHTFGNGLKEQFFSLYVEQLQTLDTPDGTVLCLVGDGFVAYSTDWRFADLSYPAGLTAKGLLKYADDGSGWDFVFWNLTLVDMPG